MSQTDHHKGSYPMLTIPQLPLSRFIFTFSYTGINQLPAYSGSAWRGALGHALKHTVCVVRNTPCQDCLLKNSCAYPYIFETPPPPNSEKMRLYDVAPHPFIIKTALDTPQTGQVQLGITLFGNGHRYLPYLIHALEKAGAMGLGKNRQPFTLESVGQISPLNASQLIYQHGQLSQPLAPQLLAIPECPDQLSVQLETPLRIKQDGKNCNQDRLNFAAFFGNLLRRISMLTYFHTDTPLNTDFAYLMAQAKTLTLTDKQLAWQDWTRYSSRQQTTMEMGGLVGTFTLTGDLTEFWPYLWLGQWTHAGKGTSMGLGAYRIRATSLPDLPL